MPPVHDLLESAARFERATEAELQSPTASRSSAFLAAEAAVKDSERRLAALTAGRPDFDAQPFLTSARELRKDGALLLTYNDSLRQSLDHYWKSLDSLDALLSGALDHNWRIFGHVFARQSLLSLIAKVRDIRSAAAPIAYTSDTDQREPSAVAAGEQQFADLLAQHQAELVRSQGTQWVQELHDALAAVVEARTILSEDAARTAQGHLSFEGRAATLASDVRRRYDAFRSALARPPPSRVVIAQTPAPAAAPSMAPLIPVEHSLTTIAATTPATSTRLSVAAISGAIVLLLLAVSVTTVRSIARPIKQFVATTERLSAGESGARFARGGVAELDTLAASLNRMAVALETAHTATREYKEVLEVRVDERTRQLRHLALHDSLTGLPNRRQLHSHLTSALLDAHSRKHRVAVFFIDLDNFKNTNDTMGHTFGDRMLQAIARRLREVTPADGFAARLGGDEFMIIQSRCHNAADAARIGEELVAAFRRPLQVESRELLVSVSVGGSLYPEHAASADALLRAADTALFSAKTLGRNQFSLFTPELLEKAATKFDIEQGLRRAVDRNEFELVFQPEVDFTEHRVLLAEALLRWRLPDRSHVSPAHFLAVAKESGLNSRISDWVLRSAIEKIAQWRAGPWKDARVAINVSASQLMGTRFLDQMQELLSLNAVPAQCIEIELTEDILQTGPSTIAVLQQLRDLGISIALDDFGTGFSTFSSLQQLPLTRVKLDQSLVASIDTDARSAAMARAIISLCSELGLTVTAEGIERTAQLELLLGYGSICCQGYLIAHPLESGAVPGAVAGLPSKLKAISARLNLSRGLNASRAQSHPDPLFRDFEASRSA